MKDFKEVSILVPHRNGEFYRDRNWKYLKNIYNCLIPDAEICLGDTSSIPYSKSEAVNNAFKKATREILVIMDSDILIDIESLNTAISIVDKYKFILPYNKLVRLDEKSTEKILNKELLNIEDIDISNNSIIKEESRMVGGIYVTTKEVYKNIGGFDERFRGWGGEDDAVLSCVKYIYGKYHRLDNILYHLYHTRQHQNAECRIKNLEILKNDYFNKNNIENTIKNLKFKNFSN
ncbi:galactosyltransferase-related protein [Paraclostridium bifermentans]|uniref:galactosyltransferase-related protein n=2 Tax=Paraclostridium bifermentans TaxID=1490 RepID=UPI00359C3D1B